MYPHKPDQVRWVFDSSAKHNLLSLKDVLLTGPDITNSILGVLLSFRMEGVAVVADVQPMFYCFRVNEDYRDCWVFWYRYNNPAK